MTFQEEIYEFGHFVHLLASVFIERRSAGVWARKYQWFDLAHVSTQLSYLSKVIKRLIQLA